MTSTSAHIIETAYQEGIAAGRREMLDEILAFFEEVDATRMDVTYAVRRLRTLADGAAP